MKVKVSNHDLESVMLELGRTLSYLTQSSPLTDESAVAGGGEMTCSRSQSRLNGGPETRVKVDLWISTVILHLYCGPAFLSRILVSTFVTWSQGAIRKCSGSSGDTAGRGPSVPHRLERQVHQVSMTGWAGASGRLGEDDLGIILCVLIVVW